MLTADARKDILPYSKVIIGTGDPIESKNLVEFRLIFEGVLPSSAGTTRRSKEKHEIRRVFHPQLRRLWTVKEGLRTLALNGLVEAVAKDRDKYEGLSVPRGPVDFANVTLHPEWLELGLAAIGENWARSGFNFVPLVTSKIALRCSVDILLLRPEENKYILEQSDIDGQLKTLFDALRLPKDKESVGDEPPRPDETPFFCLLEDDRLISEVRVLADQLLLLPHERVTKANQAFVVIHAKVNHRTGSPFDRYFDD